MFGCSKEPFYWTVSQGLRWACTPAVSPKPGVAAYMPKYGIEDNESSDKKRHLAPPDSCACMLEEDFIMPYYSAILFHFFALLKPEIILGSKSKFRWGPG